ncbi:MAG: glycosyl transferase, family 2 [Bacteriovoracaceae bacterium]|nr:glycosyl transferase, family 2 [Bacteriovoracaceae bacterium]
MITRNEEAWLDECLEHLKPLHPEFIIVDTGSTDRTKEIGAAHGARILETTWDDDFSRPRNLSLKEATRPWILVIDPDERIATRDILRLRELTEKANLKAYAFQTRNYVRTKTNGNSYSSDGSYEEEKDYPFFFLSCKVRLFRNGLNIHFKGVVHETVSDSVVHACKPGEFEEADIIFHHYGTDPDLMKKKNKRALYKKLTEKKIIDEPQNPEAFIEFARECLHAGENERALAAFYRAHQLDSTSPYYLLELVRAFFKSDRGLESKSFLEKGIQLDPNNLEYQKFYHQLKSFQNQQT